MKKVYLYTFLDCDNLGEYYHLITNRNCDELIESIENFYYDFENFETIDELVEYLRENNADEELISIITQQEEIEYLTDKGIATLTYEILDELGVLLCFDEKQFNY